MIADRLVYLAKMRALSSRQPVWIQMPKSTFSEDQLKDIKHEGLPCEVWEYDRGGEPFIEFHVDRLGRKGEAGHAKGIKVDGRRTEESAFDIVQRKSPNGGDFSVRFKAEADCAPRGRVQVSFTGLAHGPGRMHIQGVH